ncbi:hypothetical protein [Chryseobacterium scophthalmum]|uniref:Uncharacterized protein n=1 Tax=Chryseobacterium scophthalmum TaxID=59733 RepID=A0A1N6IAH1_9FLAO|nr:hypothetical protein [Chryseobacterium scophthalmum]SIO28979.1 hypothetical protein SAMN05421769_3216 [Chryseobacterium scophthalmum]
MKSIFVTFFFLSGILSSQSIELRDKTLIKYYESIINAENNIVENNLSKANEFYNIAFATLNEPQTKDIFNSMQVSIKLKDFNDAFQKYNRLKCLGYSFNNDFREKTFKNYNNKEKDCSKKIDIAYKKTLDSLYDIDQKYRNLSNGDYSKYKQEITISDSVTSLKLLDLFQKKGFPNEYDIGVNTNGDISFQKFYFIIWHQLATNRYSSQKVNFSEELDKALNKGKISPENAAFLFELTNNSNNFSSVHFDILEFFTNSGSTPMREQIINKTAVGDCCYVHVWFFPERRNEKAIQMVQKINENRKKIGLSDLDTELKKKVFYLKNKEYLFPRLGVMGKEINDLSKVEFLKKSLIKL